MIKNKIIVKWVKLQLDMFLEDGILKDLVVFLGKYHSVKKLYINLIIDSNLVIIQVILLEVDI